MSTYVSSNDLFIQHALTCRCWGSWIRFIFEVFLSRIHALCILFSVRQSAKMGGHKRLWHPKWWTRYTWGLIGGLQLVNFYAEQQYGITRSKNPDIMWPWWHEIMRKKEAGEIPMDMPGYMLCKYRNEPEERWTARNADRFDYTPPDDEE